MNRRMPPRKVRSHEIMDFKRCMRKWFWKWRAGLTPINSPLGALDLGTWCHDAWAGWYGDDTNSFADSLEAWFDRVSGNAIKRLGKLSEAQAIKAEELQMLGKAVMRQYEVVYKDEDIEVLAVEVPLEFTFDNTTYKMKLDLVYRNMHDKSIWIMEHKTARSISSLQYLAIDGQARPYGVLAERALRNKGIISAREDLAGVMYNFAAKKLPDLRKQDAAGYYLNKNGTRSKKQPSPSFKRYPVTLTRNAKRVTLERLQRDVAMIGGITERLYDGSIPPEHLMKTPHTSCERFCDYFRMCIAEENGMPIHRMRELLYQVVDPYEYPESADIPDTFEMG